MAATPQEVMDALRNVPYPGYSRDIVSFGIVRDVQVGPEGTTVIVSPPSDVPDFIEKVRVDIEKAIASIPGAGPVAIRADAPPPARPGPQTAQGPQGIPGVKSIIAVASGKGGVGKSTVATNLAAALQQHGAVGLLDADVYGPSAPTMLGVEGAQLDVTEDRRITPIDVHGMKMVSMGFFVQQGQAVIWRGPMVTKLLAEFIRNTEWGPLDYLVLDLPPGTGDVQLTLSQQLAMTGGVIVTTPQEVALADVRRGLKMFSQVGVETLGLIENMSGWTCGHCGHESDIFGRGGGERVASGLEIPFLGSIALTAGLREQGDAGTPFVLAHPDHPVTGQFREVAAKVAEGAAKTDPGLRVLQ